MAKIPFKTYKGLYTNAENVSLDYAKVSKNIRYKTGYCYTEGLIQSPDYIPIDVDALGIADYTLESVTEVIFNSDKKALLYSGIQTAGYLYIFYKVYEAQTNEYLTWYLVYFQPKKIGDIYPALIDITNNSTFLRFSSTNEIPAKSLVINDDGKVKVFNPFKAYIIQNIDRKIYYKHTTIDEFGTKNDIKSDYHLSYLMTISDERDSLLDFTVEDVTAPDTTTTTYNFTSTETKLEREGTTSRYYSYQNIKLTGDPDNSIIGGFIIRIDNDSSQVLVFQIDESGNRIDLAPKIASIEVTLEKKSDHSTYTVGMDPPTTYGFQWSSTEKWFDGVINYGAHWGDVGLRPTDFNISFAGTFTKITIPYDTIDKFDPANYRKYRFIQTIVANGEEYITRRKELLQSNLSVPVIFKLQTIMPAIFPSNAEQIKYYFKYEHKSTTDEKFTDIGEDYEEIYLYDFLSPNITNKTPNKFYINNLSPTGVYLSQALGFVYNDIQLYKNNRLDGFTSFKILNGVGYAVKNNILYYSAIGGGTIQQTAFYQQNEIIFDQITTLTGIIKINNGLGIFTEKEIILIDIQMVEGNLMFTIKDRIAMVINSIEDVIEVGSEIFLITQRGLILTDGYKETPIGDPINDKIINNTKKKRILYDKYYNMILLIIKDIGLFFYDIETKSWSEYDVDMTGFDFYFNITSDGKLFSSNDNMIVFIERGETYGILRTHLTNLGELPVYKVVNYIDLDILNNNDKIFLRLFKEQEIINIEKEVSDRRTYYKITERQPCEKLQVEIEGTFLLRSAELDIDTSIGLIQ